jgi:hypothetical protein
MLKWLEAKRWIVDSHTTRDVYLVDLEPQGKLKSGKCNCIDFAVRVEAAVNRGEDPGRFYCKHILEVAKHIYAQLMHLDTQK